MSSAFAKLKAKFSNQEQCEEASCDDYKGPSNRVHPPDRVDIGRAAWRYVHTRAAHYPDRPSADERQKEMTWIESFVGTYPCRHCAEAFVDICMKAPPDVRSKDKYSAWWSKVHDLVNEDLAKMMRGYAPEKVMAASKLGKTVEEHFGAGTHGHTQ